MPKKSPKIGQKQAVAPGFTLDYKGWAFTKSGLYVKPFQVEEPSDPGKRWFIRGYPYDVRADKAILRRFTVTPDYIASPDWDRTRKRAAARLMALEWNELLYNDQLFTNAPPPPKQEYRADMPITEAIDYFLKMAGYDHKKGTVRQYKDSLSKFKTWLTQTHRDKMRLNKFTRSDSLLYLDWLKLSKLAPATVNNHHTCLGVLFGFYIKKDIAVDYPLKNIPSLKATPTKYTAYSREQRANIREYLTSPATGDDMLLLFISLMYYTLARPGEEIRLLRVGDIGQQSITFWGENVKNSKTKTIPIEPGLEELLTKINIRSYPPDLYVFGKQRYATPTRSRKTGVRVGPAEKPVGEELFRGRHKKMLTALGIPRNYTLYSWKHSGAIEFYRATLDIKLVQYRCGHSSVRETEKYLRNLGEYIVGQSVGKMDAF